MLAKDAKKDAKHAIITIKIQYAQVALIVLHCVKLLLNVKNEILHAQLAAIHLMKIISLNVQLAIKNSIKKTIIILVSLVHVMNAKTKR